MPHILTGGPSTCNNELPEINSVKGKAAGNVKAARRNGHPTRGTVVCLLLFSSTLHLEGIQRGWDLYKRDPRESACSSGHEHSNFLKGEKVPLRGKDQVFP